MWKAIGVQIAIHRAAKIGTAGLDFFLTGDAQRGGEPKNLPSSTTSS